MRLILTLALAARVASNAIAQIPDTVARKPPDTNPRPRSGSACAHEPVGATRFNDMPWDAVPSHTVAVDGWLDDAGNARARLRIIRDSTSPMPWVNHNIVAGLFKQGDPGGGGSFYVYRPFKPSEQYRTLYICLYMKHSANFDNTNGNVGTKFLWPAGDQVEGALNYLTFNSTTMDFGVNQQGAVDREMYANVAGTSGSVSNLRGTWVQYELVLRANSSNSTADGGLDIWINGVHTHHYTDVNWQMGASRKWLSLAWTPTYGGGLHPVPHDQYEYIDHIRISGKP